ncbi:MAG: DUF4326 domain-containing protein [Bacteroidota bacterium]
MAPIYWRRSRKKGARKCSGSVKYCGRPSMWGNPYRVTLSKDNTQEYYPELINAVFRYKIDLIKKLEDDPRVLAEFLKLLDYDYLSCWCVHGAYCHVQDVIIPLLRKYEEKKRSKK